ncbi:sensor domain-containing diguanylate cyclase [Protaetiibacter sp. SSC-01]|uniref:sensor domain-containing diguanylate cyclase n=1 Tax=Protaetiibacter sp. SSC-01 TaxID=2759943 RepID=UPI001656D993|nr:sensor domain-containing diguanylate cyclase [Protaetiibacter sp. SSC-01]QNO37216.1 sensor domain-containing diguanylate cyclase [Protaetiibacter sp. SSC-01]
MHGLTACGRITIDQNSVIVDVNTTTLEWMGSERAEVVGRPLEAFLTLRMPLAGTDGMRPTDATLHGASGIVRPVVVGELDSDDPSGVQQLAVYDVSTRSAFNLGFRGAEAKTERGRQRLQILLNSAVGFGNVRTEAEAAELLADVAQRAFAASHVSVHLRGAGGLVQAAGVNPLAAHWPPGFRPTGSTTLLGGEVILVRRPEDADAYTPGVRMSDVYRAGGIHAAIASPMRSHGDSVGAMVCYFDHPREFDEEAVPLAEALSNQAAQAIARIRLEETIRRAAMHDEVTGLPSRRLVEEDVTRTLLDSYEALTVIFIDLDGFKAVNDRLGHAAGDALLREVGQRLRGLIREKDVLGRFGGDEFIVVAAVESAGDAAVLADRIRSAIAEPYSDLPADLPITASVGVVAVGNGGAPVMDQLIRAADHAMYAAKMAGGDRVSVADAVVAADDAAPRA